MPKSSKVSKSNEMRNTQKTRKSISQRDKKKTKCRVEKLNEQGLLPNELFELNNARLSNTIRRGNNSLLAKNIEQDHKADRRTRDKAKAKKEETNNKILEQIEMISGFSI